MAGPAYVMPRPSEYGGIENNSNGAGRADCDVDVEKYSVNHHGNIFPIFFGLKKN